MKSFTAKNDAYKYYIGYDYNGVIILLVIKLPKMIGRSNIFKNGKTMIFKCYNN